MVKLCASCGVDLVWPKTFSCYYCQNTFCDKHRLAENHECAKVMAAKYIEKDYLRKRGVNITSGKYAAVCRQCGYASEYEDIEAASQRRIHHIKQQRCEGKSVQLRPQGEGN